MSIIRPVLLVLAGLVAGLIIALGGAYYFARSASGQSLLRDFIVAQSAQLSSSTQASSTVALEQNPGILLVPKTYATQAYGTAINNVIADVVLINNANVAIAPLLNQLNQETLSCSYDGFYDQMTQARTLSNKNQALAAQFLMHLTALEAANTQTSDAITKADTSSVYGAGEALGASLQQYATLVQTLLYGSTPTSAQVSELQAQVAATTASSQTFAAALKTLLQYIVAQDQTLSGAASSTPATQ